MVFGAPCSVESAEKSGRERCGGHPADAEARTFEGVGADGGVHRPDVKFGAVGVFVCGYVAVDQNPENFFAPVKQFVLSETVHHPSDFEFGIGQGIGADSGPEYRVAE